jgi:lysophospholipase L1-like esterase
MTIHTGGRGPGHMSRRSSAAGSSAPVVAPLEFAPTMSMASLVTYGQGQMMSAYSGPSARVVRASDSATLDIPNANRAIDVSAVPAFTSGTTMGVSIWYNQNGIASRDAVQTTPSLRPVFRLENAMNGQYPFINSDQGSGLVLPAIATARNSVTILAVMAPAGGSKVDGSAITFASLGTSGTTTDNLYVNYKGAVGGDFNIQTSLESSLNPMKPNNGFFHTFAMRTGQGRSGGSVNNGFSLMVEGTVKGGANGAATASAMTGGMIGGGTPAQPQQSAPHWLFYAVYPGVLSNADLAEFRTWASHRFGCISSADAPQIVWDGDSITECNINVDTTKGRTLQVLTQALLPATVKHTVMAVAGQYANDAYSHRTTTTAQYDAARLANFYYLLIGSNDLDLWTNNETTIYNTYMVPLIQAVTAAGFTGLVVGTVIPRNWSGTGGGTPTQKEARRKALNALIRAGATTYGYTCVDYETALDASLLSNPTTGVVTAGYYLDGIHPNEAGYALMAPVLAAAMAGGAAAKWLRTISFSRPWLPPGTALSGPLGDVHPGATLSASGLPAGLTIDSANRRWVWDGTGTPGLKTFTLTATLAGAANSPKNTTITVGVGLAYDLFVEATERFLQDHFADDRGTWANKVGFGHNHVNNRVKSFAADQVSIHSAVVPVNQFAAADIVLVGSAVASNSAGVVNRVHATNLSYIEGRYLQGVGWQIRQRVGGTFTQVGSTFAGTAPSGTAQRMQLETSGTTNILCRLLVDGVQVISQTITGAHADLQGAGSIGISGEVGLNDTQGYHLGNFLGGGQ